MANNDGCSCHDTEADLRRKLSLAAEALEKIRFYCHDGQWLPCGRDTAAAEMIGEWARSALAAIGEVGKEKA